MYNRTRKTVQVVSFTTGTDSYGMTRQNGSTSRNVEMDLYIYTQQNNETPMYIECEAIGLTNDTQITKGNQIIDGNDKYNVLYVIPSRMKTQVLMKKVK